MNRTQFFEDSDGGYASFPQPKHFTKTWKKVTAFEESIGKTLDSGFTREEYVALFNSALARSSSTFFNDKKAVMYYIRYLVVHGVLPAEQEEVLASISVEDLRIKEGNKNRIRYFKNLTHLRDAIDDTVKVAERVDETVFKVSDILGEQRANVNVALTDYLSGKFAPYGITIGNVSLINIEVDAETSAAISAKITAQQNAETQAINNQTAIDKAKADAEVALTNAQAKADAALIEANAQAEANRLLAQSVTQQLIEYEKIEKWDGKMPTVSGSNAIVSIGGVNTEE